MMVLDDLLRRRVVFLSGKGGVGKSTVGLALALAARRRGKRTLLIEIDTPLGATRGLGAAANDDLPGVSPDSDEAEPMPGLFTRNLDPQQVMDEYVRHVVPTELLARRVLDSPIYRRFFAAAPGLADLMLLGKILKLEEARERWSRKPVYDLVIVDAPATGHGLSLLRTPLAAVKAVPVGPVGQSAKRILSLLRDAERATLLLVAIPEEMAVVEAIEFHSAVAEDVGIHVGAMVLNACHERRLTAAQEAEVLRLSARGAEGTLPQGIPLRDALTAGRRHIRRRKLTRFYEARLKRSLPVPLVSLPYLFEESLGPESLRALSERLEAS
jgi:anion-transporting  ArsA/GET3 family ATPase